MSSMMRLNYQPYEEAARIYDYTKFTSNQLLEARPTTTRLWPTINDIALMGRDDAQVVLKPREIILSAGAFKRGTFQPNIENPSFLQLKQIEPQAITGVDITPRPISQMNAVSTSINIYSPNGKFRDENMSSFEVNEELDSYGDIAKKLHPSVFGDELVKLLDLMLKFMRNHIHTPQNPPVPDAFMKQLEEYSVQGKLQNLISKHIRIN